MNLNQALWDLVAVALVAALAPIVAAVLPGRRVPQVIIFIVGGVLIGPNGLGLARSTDLQLLSNIGLASCSCSRATSWIRRCSGGSRADWPSPAG